LCICNFHLCRFEFSLSCFHFFFLLQMKSQINVLLVVGLFSSLSFSLTFLSEGVCFA
jgi:hypothetical protein